MSATPCLLVVFISQVFHDFDTYGLVPAYSSCFTLLYMLYMLYTLWTLWSDYPVLWVCLRYYIDYDVDALLFISCFLVFA